ncbi:MAG: LysR family transcriptional regulator [Clostridia bacterium]|nr:LysR family transcriptional regulator [Clostridia bacterium]
MNIRHLEIFTAVAECKKMRMAAEQLHITQPSVSQAIRELEDYYHVKLFERLSQRIYITEAGKQLLPYARHCVESYLKFEEYAFDLSHKDMIRVGASVSVGTIMLPEIVKRVRLERPDADIRVTVDNTTRIEEMTVNSELDLAIVEGMVYHQELTIREIAEDELVLVAAKPHPFYRKDQIELKDLQGEALISRELGSAERNQFEYYLAEQGIKMVSQWSCSNTETIKKALRDGEGVAILSRMLVEEELARGEFHIIPVRSQNESVHIRRKIKLLYHNNKYFSPIMDVFVDKSLSFMPKESDK